MPPRVVIHVDLDWFYAQCEEVEDPKLRAVPMGVYQKFLLVTCNGEARRRGVPKMTPTKIAQQTCPELVLRNGEDLTRYRAHSLRICKVLQGFGAPVERLVLDELFLDATELVRERVEHGRYECDTWVGHVEGDIAGEDADGQRRSLMVGTQLAAEMRAAVLERTGFTCCAGVSVNKLMAKLASGVRKPNSQSAILPERVLPFVSQLPALKLMGIGHSLSGTLRTELGVETAADLQRFEQQYLVSKFDARIGAFLYNVCRGIDNTAVQPAGPPQTISDEDSFVTCETLADAQRRLVFITVGLLRRLDADAAQHARRPTTVRLGVRQRDFSKREVKDYAWYNARETRSVRLPAQPYLERVQPLAVRAEAVVHDLLMPLLRKMIDVERFQLTLLNVAAVNFTSAAPERSIKDALRSAAGASQPVQAPTQPATTSNQIDPDVLAQLPPDIQHEVLQGLGASRPRQAPPTVAGNKPHQPDMLRFVLALPPPIEPPAPADGMFVCPRCHVELFAWCRDAHETFHREGERT